MPLSNEQQDMHDFSHDDTSVRQLVGRVSPVHLQQRLGIEQDHEASIFGQGLNFVHLENWPSLPTLMRMALRLCGLYRRGRRNALRLTVRHHDVALPGLPAAFQDVTMLHLSDVHLDMHPALAATLIERIRTVEYDISVVTGDFRGKTFGPCTPAIEAMAQVRAHLTGPVYGVLGNHDTIRMVPALEAMGIRMLLNEAVTLERAGETIYLAGIDDPHYYRADNLEKACEAIPPEAISILLAHSPEIYRHAAHVGFNMLLCGHTHGGQICLPGGIPLTCNARCPRRFCAGPWRYHHLQGYTSVGSGTSIVDVRFNCPPEITLHHLRRA
jgi:predicted MPP superfamily phosphohydrolase